MPGSLLFTRLDELQVGDSFYIEVMGEELGYKIDRIDVITPDDDSKLRVTAGEDRVTLMTCTPYGVNSHRLLVSGVRAEIPNEVPVPEDAQGINTTAVALGVWARCWRLLWVSLRPGTCARSGARRSVLPLPPR